MIWAFVLLAFMPQYHRPATPADSVYDTLPTDTKGLYFCEEDVIRFRQDSRVFLSCRVYRKGQEVIFAYCPLEVERDTFAIWVLQISHLGYMATILKRHNLATSVALEVLALAEAGYTLPWFVSMVGYPHDPAWEWNQKQCEKNWQLIKPSID